MKRMPIVMASAVVIFAVTAMGQSTKSTAATSVSQAQSSQPGLTIASAVDREISGVRKASSGRGGNHA